MDELIIYWTKTAICQRDFTFNYWNKRNRNTSYSKKLNLEIQNRTNRLKTNPYIGRKVNFKNTREIPIRNYSIFYKKMETKIIITGFWDNRQDPNKLKQFLDNS